MIKVSCFPCISSAFVQGVSMDFCHSSCISCFWSITCIHAAKFTRQWGLLGLVAVELVEVFLMLQELEAQTHELVRSGSTL